MTPNDDGTSEVIVSLACEIEAGWTRNQVARRLLAEATERFDVDWHGKDHRD